MAELYIEHPRRITERERICLEYLSDKMDAPAYAIGQEIISRMNGKGGSNLSSVGATVASRLSRSGLVAYVFDNYSWRITEQGRSALTKDARA